MSGHCVLSLRKTALSLSPVAELASICATPPTCGSGEKKASDISAKRTILNVFVCENAREMH